MLTVSTSLNVRGLTRFKSQVATGLRTHSGPFGEMFTKWAAIYAAFTRRRFNQFSRGGGNWQPLRPSTIRARAGAARGRKGKGGGSGKGLGARSSLALTRRGALVNAGRTVSILRDKGILFNAISIGATGNYVGRVPRAVIYGFAPVPHTGRRQSKRVATIQKIAHWHNIGAGRNPRRVILANPDRSTRTQLTSAMRAAVRKIMQQAAGGAT